MQNFVLSIFLACSVDLLGSETVHCGNNMFPPKALAEGERLCVSVLCFKQAQSWGFKRTF